MFHPIQLAKAKIFPLVEQSFSSYLVRNMHEAVGNKHFSLVFFTRERECTCAKTVPFYNFEELPHRMMFSLFGKLRKPALNCLIVLVIRCAERRVGLVSLAKHWSTRESASSLRRLANRGSAAQILARNPAKTWICSQAAWEYSTHNDKKQFDPLPVLTFPSVCKWTRLLLALVSVSMDSCACVYGCVARHKWKPGSY